jgi:hypothetical protein
MTCIPDGQAVRGHVTTAVAMRRGVILSVTGNGVAMHRRIPRSRPGRNHATAQTRPEDALGRGLGGYRNSWELNFSSKTPSPAGGGGNVSVSATDFTVEASKFGCPED